jgi:hypothetical protein
VLNRDEWSSLEAARILLSLLVKTFVPFGVIVVGMDDTIEGRRGGKIKAKNFLSPRIAAVLGAKIAHFYCFHCP